MTVQDFTVYDMLRRGAAAWPHAPALVEGGRTHTFRDLLARVDALADGLADGLGRGDAVCVLAQNHGAFVELYFACARLGAVVHPLNWRLSAEEIAVLLERAEPRLVVADTASLALLADGPQRRSDIPHWALMGPGQAEGFTPLERLYAREGTGSGAEAGGAGSVSADDPFVVIATAAVDVVPRGAVLTHANLLWASLQTAAAMGLGPDDANLVTLPLFHIAGLYSALAFLHAGAANVLMPRFEAESAVRLIDEHAVTHFYNFPPVLGSVLDAAEQAGSKLASLRYVSGLESPQTIERLHTATDARFWIGFGQAETSGFVTLGRADERPGSAGRPGPLSVIRLVDEFDRDVAPGEPGEILVRGPLVFQGYFRQPEVTAVTFRGGWHHTGDVGRCDEDGFLFYVRRKPEKELIKPGGENVYPAEVERVIIEVAGVRAVCVFGVPDPQWGEAVKAVVEAPAGHGLTAEGVSGHVGGRIARYKRPRHVEFTEALPRGEQGEIDREAVKARWGQGD